MLVRFSSGWDAAAAAAAAAAEVIDVRMGDLTGRRSTYELDGRCIITCHVLLTIDFN